MCVSVYMYIHMCRCVHTHVFAELHTRTPTHTQVCADVYIHTYTCVYRYVRCFDARRGSLCEHADVHRKSNACDVYGRAARAHMIEYTHTGA